MSLGCAAAAAAAAAAEAVKMVVGQGITFG